MLGIKLLIVIGITALTFLALRPIRYDRETERSSIRTGALLINLLVLLVTFIVVQGFGTVPTGHVGIVTRWDAATGATKQPGLYWVIPIRDDVIPMNVQTQKAQRTVDAASSDLQDVQATITVNYNVDPTGAANLFIKVVRNYEDAIIAPAIEDVTKAGVALYRPEEMLQNRALLRETILNELRARLSQNNILVTNIAIENLKFAEQRALEAQNKLQQVEFEAQQEIERAQAEAEKIRIQAEAIQSQGGMEYVMLQLIQAWNGNFPDTLIMSGEGGPFEILNLGDFVGN